MADAPRPLPNPTPISVGFWEAAKRKELVIQRCKDCRAWRHYPQVMCPSCNSLDWEWAPVSGRGVIYSYTVAHQAFHAHWKDKVPYVLATIELEEGVRLVDDMLELDPAAVEIGQPVEVVFEEMSDEITMPKFRVVS